MTLPSPQFLKLTAIGGRVFYVNAFHLTVITENSSPGREKGAVVYTPGYPHYVKETVKEIEAQLLLRGLYVEFEELGAGAARKDGGI